MRKLRFISLLGVLAIAALLTAGSRSAFADEIYFGNLTPTPTCSTSTISGDEGLICGTGSSPTTETFTSEGSTLQATGYSDTFSTGANLTLKTWNGTSGTAGSYGESGIGENALNSTSCTDNPGGTGATSTPCEIGNNASVALTSTVAIADLIVGSVQGPEVFDVYTGTTVGNLSLWQSDVTSATCTAGPDGSECLFQLPVDTYAVGILDLPATAENPGQSDVLLTAISLAPAPAIGQGLPVVLAVGGLLFGVWAWDRSKKRHLPGAATTPAAA